MDLSFFNPRSQSEADFIASFVARTSMLEFFLRQLRQLGPDEAARHQLIVAPRGFGKTSLLRRIAIAVRADDILYKQYLPLSFREEQHNVISLDVFWRNCLQSLLEAREEEQASEAELDAIDQAWTQLAPRQSLPRDAQDGEPAWHEFSHRCTQLGRRPILLIDNLDTLLAGLGNDQQWSLRQTLQRSDGPVVIAAASRYPESTHDPNAAFYDFFRIQTLDRLENAEVLLCLRTLARHRGVAGRPVLALLDSDPGRVAALNTLAGGNPRTLGVLYGVLESHMSTDVLSQLSAMLDTFTGWYQARTEELPIQARAVFDALALNWDPMTAAAVGQTTGLETVAVSSQLSRLEKLGYVEAVALSRRGKGRSGFQVVERFFNIWYLMRNGPRRARQSIKFLTVFLQSCFSAPERRSLGRRLLGVERIDPGYVLALASTFREGPMRERLRRADAAAWQSTAASEYQAIIQSLRPQLARDTDSASTPMHSAAVALFNEGVTLSQLGRSAEAIVVYDSVVSRFGAASELALREPVARALVNKGVTLSQLGRSDEEIVVYDSVVSRFGETSELALRLKVAGALVNKGFTLGQLGRSDEAIAVYASVVSRFGEASELALREGVAGALVNKGSRLGQLGRSDEAIVVYDSVVSRFGEASELALRERVALALFNKGVSLGQLGRSDEEIAVYDSVVSRFGAASELALREEVAGALVNKGVTLGQLGRSEEEIAVYDSVVSRFGAASELALRERVARAESLKAGALVDSGQIDAAEAVLRSGIRRLPQSAGLWNSLGNLLLDAKGDPVAAEKAYLEGLSVAKADDLSALHANCAYVLALHIGDHLRAQEHIQRALAEDLSDFTAAGRALLSALPKSNDADAVEWSAVFSGIGRAVDSGDAGLWTNYLDDLQRLLWFVIAHKRGDRLREWMIAKDYPLRQAPLYHAVVAAIDGEDYLLQINPETRAPASRIYQGIARRLQMYAMGSKPQARGRTRGA